MADDRVTRVDANLFEAAAAAEGRRDHRSGRRQLELWARVGRGFSAHDAAAARRIAAAVHGATPISSLASGERFIANVELDVTIRERAASASFGRALLEGGASAVALDESGTLVAFDPSGATRPLA